MVGLIFECEIRFWVRGNVLSGRIDFWVEKSILIVETRSFSEKCLKFQNLISECDKKLSRDYPIVVFHRTSSLELPTLLSCKFAFLGVAGTSLSHSASLWRNRTTPFWHIRRPIRRSLGHCYPKVWKNDAATKDDGHVLQGALRVRFSCLRAQGCVTHPYS